MKTLGWTILAVVVLAGQAQAQLGDVELGFSSGVAFMAGKNNWDVPFVLRCGIHLGEGFVIEPEIATSASPMDAEQMFSYGTDFFGFNVQYNFTSREVVCPFILGGIGISRRLAGSNYSESLQVPELGCGVKFFTSPSLDLRLEYRFRSYSGERPDDVWVGRTQVQTGHRTPFDVQFHALMLGIGFNL